MGTQKGYASVDGKRTPLHEGTVPIIDRGFLYGDSVYEVFRTYSGVPFLGAEHWQRLLRSADLIRFQISESTQDLHAEIARTIAAWRKNGGTDDAYVRYAYTRGCGPIDLYPAPDLTPLRVIIVKAIPEWPAHHYSEGLTLAIPSVRRNPVDALNPCIKGGNYLNNVLGVLQARELGAEDCLLLNQKQYLTEASNSNVLFVIDNAVQTPSVESGILSGLTKGALEGLWRLRVLGDERVDHDDLAAGRRDLDRGLAEPLQRHPFGARRARGRDAQDNGPGKRPQAVTDENSRHDVPPWSRVMGIPLSLSLAVAEVSDMGHQACP